MKKIIISSLLLFSSMSYSYAFFSGNDVPTCKSSEARELINEIFQEVDMQVIDLRDISEEGYNKSLKTRICSGNVSISGYGSEYIEYQISISKDDPDYFYLEILP